MHKKGGLSKPQLPLFGVCTPLGTRGTRGAMKEQFRDTDVAKKMCVKWCTCIIIKYMYMHVLATLLCVSAPCVHHAQWAPSVWPAVG